jgi:hypothetical protein
MVRLVALPLLPYKFAHCIVSGWLTPEGLTRKHGIKSNLLPVGNL